jgi:hypothetical protein
MKKGIERMGKELYYTDGNISVQDALTYSRRFIRMIINTIEES